MSGSNQYPRLPWARDPDPVHGGFVAHPHGPDAGRARIYYQRLNHDGWWWQWVVGWPGRFSESGTVSARSDALARQAAADKATIAYWDAMEQTEGWTKPLPPPAPQPPPLPAMMIKVNVLRWLERWPTQREARERMQVYREASTRGPCRSGDPALDRWVWMVLADSWRQLPG